MSRISEAINYSLRREIVNSPFQLQKTGYHVNFDAHFNWNVVRPLKANKMIFIPQKTYVLEEVNFPFLTLNQFISQKGIRSRSIEDLYANAVNFVEVWTQPGNPLFLSRKVVVLHLGFMYIENVCHHAKGILDQSRYKIILDTSVNDTRRGDFWLV